MTERHTIRRCRQCREQGHDIRNCPLFGRIHKEGIAEYNQWIHHCIVDYHTCNKWQYDIPGEERYPLTDLNLLRLFIENRDGENAVESVLKVPTTWIQNQTLEYLRILGQVYGFPKTEPYKSLTKENWVILLHFLLFLEVEQARTRKLHFEVQEAVTYLYSSIQSFQDLESIHTHIHNLPLMIREILLKPELQLEPLVERYTKIRDMRAITSRNLHLMQQELNENYREEVGIRRRMNDLRIRRTRVANEARRIEMRVVKYESEMIMFLKLPPDPPQILFVCSEERGGDTDPMCSICYEPMEKSDIVHLECNHEFCASCVFLTISGRFKEHSLELDDCLCPFCRGKILKIYGNVENMKAVLKNICNIKKLPRDFIRMVGGE
jgi:hypothetical protein